MRLNDFDEVNVRNGSAASYLGRQALESLYAAKEYLDSARTWGIFDMLGGGFFSTLVKQSKMSKANDCIKRAKRDLEAFSSELKNSYSLTELNIETGDFISFADYFFDSFFVDWLMQDRIVVSRRKIDDAIYQVEKVLRMI